MIFLNPLFLWFISFVRLIVAVNIVSTGESGAQQFLKSLNGKSAEIASKLVSAQWDFETNNTENAKKELFQITSEAIKNAKQRFRNVVNRYPWRSFSDPDVRRQLKLYSEIGTLALPTEEEQKFQEIMSDLNTVKENSTICDYYNKTKCDLHLNPDLKEKLETSQYSKELEYLSSEWRKATEPQLRKLLEVYVKLCNQAAVLNNYTNFKEYSLRNIEAEDIKEEITSLWEGIRPLYQQIHAYVRRKLRDIYTEENVPRKGPIPAHFLGNVWPDNWLGIVHRIVPFPEEDNLNLTSVMISQGLTPLSIRELAENLFKSMNFSIPPNLWFNDTSDASRTENCHPKIFNFFDDDIRIKDCGRVSLKDYLTANRLLAQAEFMLQYSHQPFVYQSPADPGLEEAVSDVVILSASTVQNLKKLGLYENGINEKVRLNRLFKLALDKITSIPFLMVQEFWRWDVYSGKPIEDTIATLKNFREKFQGISTFTKELSFDPGGVGSVFSQLSLAHTFLGYFLEFQIYETLCRMSGEPQKANEALDECSLYGNAEAGLALRNLMKSGSSKSLKETLAPVLGMIKINSTSIMKYFEPLMTWLKKENEESGEFIGWEGSKSLKDFQNKSFSKKTRRKRSLEDYPSEGKDGDEGKNLAKEPDRFQRVNNKRSKDGEKESELSDAEQKSAESERKVNDKDLKNKNTLLKSEKERRSPDKAARRLIFQKNRRSADKNNKNVKDSAKEEERANENTQKTNKFTNRNNKRHSGSESFGQPYDTSKTHKESLNKKEETSHKKRSEDSESSKNYANAAANPANANRNVASPGSKTKVRYARRARKKQRRFDSEEFPQNHLTAPRKDKRDSNLELRGEIVSNESPYSGVVDYNRLKAAGSKIGINTEEKVARPIWSVKSLMTGGATITQTNSLLNKKEGSSGSQLPSSLTSEEKAVGKKESPLSNTGGLVTGKNRPVNGEGRFSQGADSALRQLSIDLPTLQVLLKNADLISSGQKPTYTMGSESSENKGSTPDLTQDLGAKLSSGKASFSFKNSPNDEIFQVKDKKEYKDLIMENQDKSPYIIILGQVSPEMRARLLQEKASQLTGTGKPSLLNGANSEDKAMSDKKNRALSEQLYIVPIDLKSTQSAKADHYAEHEHEAGHDPNTERDQESEERQLHVGENSKLDDKDNYFNLEKESPSEFILSWNNDKNKKIVKRSKREHKRESGEDKMEMVRIVPMKGSLLEGLLGKSFDHGNLNDKNVKILIHDGLLSGNPEMSSSLSAPSPIESFASGNVPLVDQSQTSAFQSSGFQPQNNFQSAGFQPATAFQPASFQPSSAFQPAAFQPSSSLSSLASSFISALSPQRGSQINKAANQRMDAELDEDNTKESYSPGTKEQKVPELPFIVTPGLRCNALIGKKKSSKLFSDDDLKKVIDFDSAAKGDDACCKKIILSSCPPKCPSPNNSPYPNTSNCPYPSSYPNRDSFPNQNRETFPGPTRDPCPMPTREPCTMPTREPGPGRDPGQSREPCPPRDPGPSHEPFRDPCPDTDPSKKSDPSKSESSDNTCKKPSECSLVNCQFKITKAKKPHERLTIMIYDRINPPAELPEPYDALAVISEILQRIQSCAGKPSCQLTEEDPDYPANDNSDQLKGTAGQSQENKAKAQELNGEVPILGSDSPEDDEGDDNPQNGGQNPPSSADEDKYQPKEKATPAIDQLTVFNKDKLKPVFIELRKIDDIIKKRSQQEQL